MDFQGGDVSFIYDDVRCLLLLLCSCYYCTCMDFGMILIISTHPLFYIYIGEECDENDCVCVSVWWSSRSAEKQRFPGKI